MQEQLNGGDVIGDINNQSDLLLKFNNITDSIDILDSSLTSHKSDTNNPHQVTKNQIGLGNVDNTADIDKPVSTLQQQALNTLSGNISTVVTAIDNHVLDTNNPHQVTKTQIGLANVDNTADIDKPVSTAQQTAINTAVENIPYKTLTKLEYETLASIDNNTLYFISDIDN